jgi:hypothetical protein
MGRSIDELLSNEQPEAVVEPTAEPETQPEAAVEAEPVAEGPRGPERDEQGRFKAKQETGVQEASEPQPVPPTEQNSQLPPHEYAALKDERRKRQALEDEARQLREALTRMQVQPQQQPQQAPEFWDDPQSFMDQRFSQMTEQLFQQWEQRQQVQRIDASEQAAKAKYADYDDAYQAFEQAVRLNPTLAVELAQAPDPGEFAYRRGKTARAIQSVGSLEELEAQIRAKVMAEAQAAIAPARSVLPSTTAADGSVGVRGGPEWTGPRTIDDYLR